MTIFYLSIARVCWVAISLLLIIPETVRLYDMSKLNNDMLARALYREHVGKISYLVTTASIFFYTSLNETFYIFGIQVGWIYAAAELIFVLPTIRRRLGLT